MRIDSTRPLLALFAHPDDEFAVFPWIEAAVASKRIVHCAWITDGGWGGQDVARRRHESIRVLASLGVSTDCMHFLGERFDIRDGELHCATHRAGLVLDELATQLPHGAEWLIPAWEGGHQDHDALHLLAISCAERFAADLYQYPLYNGAGLPGPWFRVLHALPRNGRQLPIETPILQRLSCVVRCFRYRSQWKSFVGLLPFYALAMLRRHPFVLQTVIADRANKRPHEGKVLYERRGGPSWETVRAAVALRSSH